VRVEEPPANVWSGLAVGRVAWIRAGSTSILALGESRWYSHFQIGVCRKQKQSFWALLQKKGL